MFTKPLVTACFAILFSMLLASCKDAPGADGRLELKIARP